MNVLIRPLCNSNLYTDTKNNTKSSKTIKKTSIETWALHSFVGLCFEVLFSVDFGMASSSLFVQVTWLSETTPIRWCLPALSILTLTIFPINSGSGATRTWNQAWADYIPAKPPCTQYLFIMLGVAHVVLTVMWYFSYEDSQSRANQMRVCLVWSKQFSQLPGAVFNLQNV